MNTVQGPSGPFLPSVWVAPLLLWFGCFVVAEHFPPWFAFHTEAPAFLASFLGLLLVGAHRDAAKAIPSIAVLPAVLLCAAVAQAITGGAQYTGDVAVLACYLACLIGSIWWGYTWAKSADALRVLVPISLAAAAASGLLTFQIFCQWLQIEVAFSGWVIDHQTRPFGNLGQPNQAATVLVMGAIGIFILHGLSRVRWPVTIIATGILAFATALTQSRTALLSSLLVTVVSVWCPARTMRRSRIVCIAWMVLMLCSTAFLHSEYAQFAAPTSVVELAKAGERPTIWKQIYVGIKQHPILGWGASGVAAAQQAGSNVFPSVEQTNYSHNAMLDVFVTFGIPVGLLVLGLAIFGIWRRRVKLLAGDSALSAALLTVPFFTHAMLELPHAYSYFLVLVGGAWGAIDAWTEPNATPKFYADTRKVRVLAAAFGVLIFVVFVDYFRVEEDFRIARFENRRIGAVDPDYRPPKLLLLNQFAEMLHAMRIRAVPNMHATDLELLKRVSKRFTWAPIHFRTALALALNNRPEEAVEELKVVKNLFPADVYQEAKDNWREMENGRYPVLSEVQLP